jgi:hypothetical protein
MSKDVKLCKICKKQFKALKRGCCDKCLAINVVKEWLKKDGVK